MVTLAVRMLITSVGFPIHRMRSRHGRRWSFRYASGQELASKSLKVLARNARSFRPHSEHSVTEPWTDGKCILPTLPTRFPEPASRRFASRKRPPKWRNAHGYDFWTTGRGMPFILVFGPRRKNAYG